MKAFTVTEQATKGIQIPVLLGNDNAFFGMRVGGGLLGDLKKALEVELEMANKEDELKELTQYIDTLESMLGGRAVAPMLLQSLDMNKDRTHIMRENSVGNRDALIHLVTKTGDGGKINLYANTVDEVEDADGVLRIPRPFPPPGVQLVGETDTDTGKEWLIKMRPRSSFKIIRSGDLQGAPPELVVLWTGRWQSRVFENSRSFHDPSEWGLRVFHRDRGPHRR